MMSLDGDTTIKDLYVEGNAKIGTGIGGPVLIMPIGGNVLLENPSGTHVASIAITAHPYGTFQGFGAEGYPIWPKSCTRGNSFSFGPTDAYDMRMPGGGVFSFVGYVPLDIISTKQLENWGCPTKGGLPGVQADGIKGPMGMWPFPLLNMLKGKF